MSFLNESLVFLAEWNGNTIQYERHRLVIDECFPGLDIVKLPMEVSGRGGGREGGGGGEGRGG